MPPIIDPTKLPFSGIPNIQGGQGGQGNLMNLPSPPAFQLPNFSVDQLPSINLGQAVGQPQKNFSFFGDTSGQIGGETPVPTVLDLASFDNLYQLPQDSAQAQQSQPGFGESIGALGRAISPSSALPSVIVGGTNYGEFVKNKDQIEKETESYLRQTGSPFTSINNLLFDVKEKDFRNAIYDATQTSESEFVPMKSKIEEGKDALGIGQLGSSIQGLQEESKLEEFNRKGLEEFNKEQEVARNFLKQVENLTGKKYTEDVKTSTSNENNRVLKLVDDKLRGEVNKALNPTSLEGFRKQYNIGQNLSKVEAFVQDLAGELSPYGVNMKMDVDRNIAVGNFEAAKRITEQYNTNVPNITDKVTDKIKFITNYVDVNKASPIQAESAFEDYVRANGYSDINAYMLEGNIDETGTKITKDVANGLSNVQTWKDVFNTVNQTNRDSYTSPATLLQSGLERAYNGLLSLRAPSGLAGGFLKGALSPVIGAYDAITNKDELSRFYGKVDDVFNRNITPGFSETASADLSNSYGLGFYGEETGLGLGLARFGNTLGDKLPSIAAGATQVIATEGAAGVGALRNLRFVDDVTRFATLGWKNPQKIEKVTEFLAKNLPKEYYQNIAIDSVDPNSDMRANQILNMYGTLFALGFDGTPLLRDLNILNNSTAVANVNNMIKQSKVGDIMSKAELEGKPITKKEAQDIFDSLSNKEKGTIDTTYEGLEGSREVFNAIENGRTKEIKRIQEEIASATPDQRPILQKNLDIALASEKKGFIEQYVYNKIIQGNELTPQDANIIARVLRDSENPQVAIKDLARVMEAQIGKQALGTNTALAGIIGDASRGKVVDSGPFIEGKYQYADGGVTAKYAEDVAGLSVRGSYTREQLAKLDLDTAQKDRSGLIRTLLQKNDDGSYKYFNDIGNETYSLNDAGLSKLNVSNYDSRIKVQRSIVKEPGSFISTLREEKGREGLEGVDDAVINKLEETDAYGKTLSVVDLIIPC